MGSTAGMCKSSRVRAARDIRRLIVRQIGSCEKKRREQSARNKAAVIRSNTSVYSIYRFDKSTLSRRAIHKHISEM